MPRKNNKGGTKSRSRSRGTAPANIWIDPDISRKMKGSGGSRAFDPAAEAYRKAYLASQSPRVEVAELENLPRYYEIAHEDEKRRPTSIVHPIDRPEKNKNFPHK